MSKILPDPEGISQKWKDYGNIFRIHPDFFEKPSNHTDLELAFWYGRRNRVITKTC
jgi:hypothetical protein